MRLRTFGIAAVLATSLFQPTGAFVRPKGAEEAVVAAERGGRTHRETGWSSPFRSSRLANKLAADGLAGWTAQWDLDTEVPLRMWGSGIVVSGSVANPAIAENAARQFLAQHLRTLAPGASAADFELVSNVLNPAGDTRSVGFVQKAGGVRVLGGAVGFGFKADRLAMVSSTALPNVGVPMVSARLSVLESRSRAMRWLGEDGHVVVPRDRAQADLVIYPIVRPRLKGAPQIEYRLAEQVEVDAVGQPGTWMVWVDAANGAPIARKSGIRYASGKVLFDVADRHPGSNRSPQPAPFARFLIGGVQVQSEEDGTITWAGTGSIDVQVTPIGQFVNVINKASGGARVSEMVNLSNNGSFMWSKAAAEFEDAQIVSYVYANQAKAFTRANLNPNLGWLNDQLAVAVNENSSCNAYSTGDDIHFFRRGNGCENTGRLSDVVYHEFGHSLHAHSIIPGVGDFDGALSEGISDWLSSAITHDPGMGRGFFMSNNPLRNLDPANGEKVWGVHTTGEVHDDGEIIGGTLWDLRTALFASLGEEAGYAKWLEISYAIMQRAADIPSSYAEALLADDDDGNLENGTPNQCDIDNAFGIHGLADLGISLGLRAPSRDGYKITIAAPTPANAACEVPTITRADLEWKIRGGTQVGVVPLTEGAEGLSGEIPAATEGSVVQYKVYLQLSNGTRVEFPNNKADPYYEFYEGTVEPIKCFDFEDPASHGWTSTSDWQVAEPAGLSGDPKEAHGGAMAFGIDLTSDGAYRNRTLSSAESPEIDLAGETNVRLQYYRHLGVEDGVFDTARIYANGTEVWKNFTSPSENGSNHHLDKEWVFHDVDLSAHVANGKLKLKFDLMPDQGLSFGGWTIDDVCVVRVADIDLPEDPPEAGCCSSSGGVEGSLALGLLTLGFVFRPRRRRI